MVQKKTKAKESVTNWLQRSSEEYNRTNPVVEVKWSVEEVTPGYNTGGYYDVDVPEESVQVSVLFDSLEAAESWKDEHVADAGKYLAIRKHTARKHTFINWTSQRVRD